MTDTIFTTIRARVIDALAAAIPGLAPELLARVEVTPTRDPAHGDLATNAALIAAKPARQPPAAHFFSADGQDHGPVTANVVPGV